MKSSSGSRKTSARRTTVPRRATSFGGMLARLGLASTQLQSVRKRRR